MFAIRFSISVLVLSTIWSFAQAAPPDNLLAPSAVTKFYFEREGTAVWNDENYSALLSAIEDLNKHGLNPDHYHLSALYALKNDPPKRDRLASDAWFSAASHIIYGKLNPVSFEPDWTAAKRKADLAAVLNGALESATIAESLNGLAPRQPGYHALKQELATLRAQAAKPITPIPEGPALRKGSEGSRVEILRARLIELGFLDANARGISFDDAVEDAVKIFQADADLSSDGIVGVATLRALNRGPQERIGQVRVNLERWRWLPDDLGQRHIRVNIAGFTLTIWEDGAPLRTHLAIVGKYYRKTPVFSDSVQYMIFNPWWETPPNIARKDKLPAFRKDPSSVARLGFQVLNRNGELVDPDTIDWTQVSGTSFPYRLRQSPGPQNALGQVKIMFPNAHNVYIHDTPSRELFSRRQRAFSSGCIRTHEPLDLAEWLLRETPQWDRSRIDTVVASGKETRATLASRVSVHILYSTVVPEPTGNVRYLDDIYERDGVVLAGLIETPS